MNATNSSVRQPSMLGTLSVREVCDFELLRSTRVVAGESGMSRRVQRLNVMSVPDIVQWTKPQEFLLATGFALSRHTGGVGALVRDLDERGVSALAAKLGDYDSVLDSSTLRTADERGLPVIVVPEEVAFNDILSEVLATLTNRQAAALGRAQDVHQALLRISLDGGGLDDIARELSSALGGIGVVCVNTAGEILTDQMGEAHWELLRQADLFDQTGGLTRLSTPTSDTDRPTPGLLAVQVSAGELRYGYLVVASVDGPLDREIEMMVQQAALVAALNISRELAVSAVARRFEASAIHGLLTGTEKEIDEVSRRSRSFEWDLDRPLLVLAARRQEAVPQAADAMRHEHDLGAWNSAVRAVDRGGAAGLLGRNLVAICGAGDDPDTLATQVNSKLKGTTRTSFVIGTSGAIENLSSLPRAYQHARTALDFAQQTASTSEVMSYDNLGLFRLLNAIPERRELETFVNETVGPLLAMGDDERDEMLLTLETLFKSRMNVAESSRTMHYHYNTLRYRIRKLEQLLGPFTEDSQLELRITVALQILQMWHLSD